MKKYSYAMSVFFLVFIATTPASAAMSDEEFFELCKYGSPVEIQTAIENGANVNSRDNHGWTPLMIAAWINDENATETLIKNGADVNARDNEGRTSLMWAAAYKINNAADVLETLIKNGADINAQNDNGSTPLMWAVTTNNNNVDASETLIRNGADVNARDENGWTPLMRAVKYNDNTDITETLIKNGANINAQDNNGQTPLIMASQNENQNIRKILIKYGAKDLEASTANSANRYAYDPKKPETVVKAFALACIDENVEVFNDLFPPEFHSNALAYGIRSYGTGAQEYMFEALYEVKEDNLIIISDAKGAVGLYNANKARNYACLGKEGNFFLFGFNRHGKINIITTWPWDGRSTDLNL
jgi:ankyrin repeat protein